jgi:hypothetical protein
VPKQEMLEAMMNAAALHEHAQAPA